MLGNILSTGEQVLILVVLLAVGFLCGKIRIFNDQSISHLSAFALKIVGPCAIVESFCRQFDSAMLRAMGIVALLAFAAHALYAAFAYVCIRGGKEPTRRVLRYGTVFANCGYMGLPLQQVLFGADGVFYGATWIGVYNLVAWSFGLVLMSGDRRQISFKKLLLNPGILAVLTGIVIFVCSIELPTIILQPIHYFSALNVPVPMVISGYEDGTVKPNAGITRAEVATIFFRLLTDGARERFWSESNAYSDVAAGSWYNIAVSTLSNMGILGGYEDGTFRPNASITRAEFAKIAVSFFDWADVYAVNSFVDVRDSAWYANYVAVAAEIGLIEGYGGNVFRPDATITRAEACTIINRTLGRAPDADHLLPVAQMNTWPDNSDTGVWYYAQIQEATNSHDYRWLGDIEQWTAKLTDPDWDKLQY